LSSPRAAVRHEAEALADAALTADRVETKYLLEQRAVRAFVRVVADELSVHRFVGEGANLLPDAQHYVTSIYFDTPTHEHYRAALADAEHNVKVRGREYYDLMPSLAELAIDPSQIVRYQPWLWFEVKQRVEGRSRKRRLRLDKHEVPAFLRAGVEPTCASTVAESTSSAGDPHGPPRSDTRAEIQAYLRTLREPLAPSCIVNYRRLALQDVSARVRVTVDLEVGYYAAPPDLWTRSTALVRGTFGTPVAIEPRALVEVKCVGPVPAWLERELSRLGLRHASYSKFVHAARAVHG
jgi:hypothetical protein